MKRRCHEDKRRGSLFLTQDNLNPGFSRRAEEKEYAVITVIRSIYLLSVGVFCNSNRR